MKRDLNGRLFLSYQVEAFVKEATWVLLFSICVGLSYLVLAVGAAMRAAQ